MELLLFRNSSLSLSLCRTIWGCLQGEGNGIAQYAGGVDIRREEGGREGGTIHICLAEKEGREGRGNEQGLLSPKKERKLQLSLFKILKVLVLSFSSLEVPLFFLSFFLLC